MNVKFQTNDAGEQIAILPRREYESMREALDHAAALADYREGKLPGLTPDEMRDMLAATSALAFWRKYRGKSQAVLANEVNISQNYLSDIETGKREGGVGIWLMLAAALDLPLDAIHET